MKALYIVGTDPIGDGQTLPKADFVVVQELFLTETAKQADVVLPALSWAERDGTFTNAERRVQRYYKALPPTGQAKADWEIFQHIAEALGLKWMFFSAESVMDRHRGEGARVCRAGLPDVGEDQGRVAAGRHVERFVFRRDGV